MIVCDNGVRIVQDESELPYHLVGSKYLFVDLETTSRDSTKRAVNPWHDCWIAGICITADDHKGSWYVPIGHSHGRNIDRQAVTAFLTVLFDKATHWVNHNIKFDTHVLRNDLGLFFDHIVLVCTQTLAKIIDSDRKFKGGYGLAHLSKVWLRVDIDHYEEALDPYRKTNKDYGRIPIDILGEYGGQDVLTNRQLYHYCLDRRHNDCIDVWNTEIELTRVLFDMEAEGLKVNPTQLQITKLITLSKMLKLEEEIAEIVGRAIRPHVGDDCFEVLCTQYGLPILGYTEDKQGNETNNPSFDKHILKNYLIHPNAPTELVKKIIEYRKLNTFQSLFLNSFLKYQKDGRIHCDYNQAVSTARLSCKAPNFQQADKAAKELIDCDDGYVFLDLDYSQIEYRTIVHYTEDVRAIAAYNQNPDIDFHNWVKDMIGIKRRPAKTVNFLMGFGGGEELLVSKLMTESDLVEPLKKKCDDLLASGEIKQEQHQPLFMTLAREMGKKVYRDYHENLPTLKSTSYQAGKVCKQRGYVRNLAGRHRHLLAAHSHKAFNSLNQSSAADIQKERTVALWKYCKPKGIKLVASVHDNTLFKIPKELATYETHRDLACIMEHPRVTLSVPLRTAGGYSDKNWLEASNAEDMIPYDEIQQRWPYLKGQCE